MRPVPSLRAIPTAGDGHRDALDFDLGAIPRVFPLELPTISKRERRPAGPPDRDGHDPPLRPAGRSHRPASTPPSDAYARPLRRTFEELGATFMKFGQLIGSSPGVFGESVAQEFRSCLDTGPSVPFERGEAGRRARPGHEARRGVLELLGDAHRHARRSRSCTRRPPVTDAGWRSRSCGPRSSAASRRTSTCSSRCSRSSPSRPGSTRPASCWPMFQGFRVQIGEELDLRNEARAMAHYRRLLDQVDLPRVMVPEVFPELSGPRVITMEFLDGVPVDDLTTVAQYGYDPAPVVQEVIKGFLLTTIRWGTFHGDVHAGNLMLLPDGRVGRHRLGDRRTARPPDPPVLPSPHRGRARRRGGLARHRTAHPAHVRPGAVRATRYGRRRGRGLRADGAQPGADPSRSERSPWPTC